MSSKQTFMLVALWFTCFMGLAVYANESDPNLPDDFPELVVVETEDAAPGVIIGTIGKQKASYNVVLEASGTPLFYSKTETLTKFVQTNGLIAVINKSIGGFNFKDETFAVVDSFAIQDCTLDNHHVWLLPNGHCLMIGKETRNIDMSQLVDGGRPDATVTGNVVQEINTDKEVIFEWHTFDHMSILDSFWGLTKKSIDYAHINYVQLDPKDNNLVCSFRQTTDIVKISRSTGEIVWRLGGQANDFTFIGEHEENAPYYFVGQHSAIPLLNGNLVLFDNGNGGGGEGTPSDRDYTRIVEYALDEVNMTATMVWEYRHSPDIYAQSQGNIYRLPNGNTFIWWGAGVRKSGVACTEVSPAGEVVNEITFPATGPNSSLAKQLWNTPDLVSSETFTQVETGQTYEATASGVTVTVNSLDINEADYGLVISKHDEATRFARFVDRDPQVLVKRVTLTADGLNSIEIDATIETTDLQCLEPNQLTVYYRPVEGEGEFVALETSFDDVNETLTVCNVSPGEFVFGLPDAPEIANVPTLWTPDDGETVNQSQPVELSWIANGFFRSFALQVATDTEFTNLVVDEPNLTENSYTLDAVDAGTTYSWRVSTSNAGGTSDWASASFSTVPAAIEVMSPNGGEVLQRGADVFIQWQDNLAENVVIALYKADVLVQEIGTVSSIGAYQWEVALDVEAGDDYTIKIRSSEDESIADSSDATFTLE